MIADIPEKRPAEAKIKTFFGSPISKPMATVELRRHHAGRILRWTPQITSKDNGAIAQFVRNNLVAVDIVRK